MTVKALSEKLMRKLLERLDQKLPSNAHLIVGGGGALALAYNFPLTTQDIDAFAAKQSLSMAEMDALAKEVAKELNVAPDWLNSHFVTFTHVLPADYSRRLRRIFVGQRLVADALGPEDLLIMKLFAGREKDRPHAKHLLRLSDVHRIEEELSKLIDKRIPGAQRAADFFDDLQDEADVGI